MNRSPRLRVFQELGGKKFQRDKPIEPDVLPFVYDAHAPVTDHIHDAIVRYDTADQVEGVRFRLDIIRRVDTFCQRRICFSIASHGAQQLIDFFIILEQLEHLVSQQWISITRFV